MTVSTRSALNAIHRRDNVVLLRSGRHLRVAVETLTNIFPGRRLLVVSQPGTETILDQLGIEEGQRIIYGARRFFSPLAFACSAAGRRLRREGIGDVAVLWNDPEGMGQSNVNRTALLLSPKGFLAIAPDGSVHRQWTVAVLGRETRRILWSTGAWILIQVFLLLPAALLRPFRK